MTANPYAEPAPAVKRTARHIYRVPLRTPDPTLQPALDFTPPQPATGEPTIEARFQAFHTANPHVYAALRSLALAQIADGARVVRTKWLFETLRTTGCTTTGDGSGYSLNNIFTAHYARLLDQEPGLQGRIPMRAIKSE